MRSSDRHFLSLLGQPPNDTVLSMKNETVDSQLGAETMFRTGLN